MFGDESLLLPDNGPLGPSEFCGPGGAGLLIKSNGGSLPLSDRDNPLGGPPDDCDGGIPLDAG